MKDNIDQEYKRLVIFNIFMIVFFGTLLAAGSFADEQIARFLYSPDNTFVKFVTSTGVYPFFAFAVLFTGALCGRMITSEWKKPVKILLCTVSYAAAAFVGFIGAGSIVDKDCLGSIYPALDRNIPVIVGICLVCNPVLLILGYMLAKKAKDGKLLKRIIYLLVLLAVSYGLMQIFKNTFHRPRFRLVAQGYDGIGFIPWYTPFPKAAEFIEKFGIDKGEFRSFPSGHSILSMSLVIIMQSVTWFSEKLKDKRFIFGLTGMLFAIMIMFTRMILGAHYLSDVASGAVISSCIALVYTVIQHKISGIKAGK